MVYRETSTESKATATNAETAATDEPTVTNETTEAAPEEVEISATWEVVNDDVNVQKEEETTLATDAEPTTAVHPEVVKQKDNSSKLLSDKPTVGGYTSKGTESLASWEVVKDEKSALEHESAKPADTEAVEVAIYKDESESAILAALDTASILKKQLGLLSSDSTSELEEPSLNANNAEESESAAWEVVDDETNVEDASSKPTDTDAVKPAVSENAPESSANSVQAKKTPTAFMFYKKAMRRLNADQNFGKKDNVSQRQALISDWKKLSDEDKAVYFEKELLARL
uniref:HMG box domain-containing protein n=1 Tax=Panagrellus redivivus TaxID=6233 RepID=A0A7E4W0X9_PANRE